MPVDVFDELRLREPLAHAFQGAGLEDDEGWRAAARIKLALLIQAGVFAAAEPPETHAGGARAAMQLQLPIHSSSFWQDPDVRWLTSVHEAGGHTYFVQEQFEELLWWLQLPALCRLAADSLPQPSAVAPLSKSVADAAAAAAHAGYRVEAMMSGELASQSQPDDAVEALKGEDDGHD